MKIVAVIPARYKSSRFEGKPLANILGKPMIQHVYENSKKSKILDEVYVATDDKRIFDVVSSFKGNVIMTSNEHMTGMDRVGEVLKKIDCDFIVNIQGDEPLVNFKVIDCLLKPIFEDNSIDIITTARKIDDNEDLNNPNIVKLIKDNNNFVINMSRNIVPYGKKVECSDFYHHIGIYCFKKEVLEKFISLPPSDLEKRENIELLRILEKGYKIKVVETNHLMKGVDTYDDLKIVERILQR